MKRTKPLSELTTNLPGNLLETMPGNVAQLLTDAARLTPDAIAVAHDTGLSGRPGDDKSRRYDTTTFLQLDQASDRIALGLQQMGVQAGMRIALLVPPGVQFVSLVYGLLKSGAITVLIDPGMGRRNMIRCLAEAGPEGFVAIPAAQAVRCVLRSRFPKAKFNVTVGRRWFWGGATLGQIEKLNAADFPGTSTAADDPAAIIFTTGSTGPSKGVLYHHRNFIQQAYRIREHYEIENGGADLSAFPLFALFNALLGKTTVIPDMDATRPADADPQKIIDAVTDWQTDQSFGSPALWNTVTRYCEEHDVKLPTLKRVLSAGAPVPVHVLKRLKNIIAADGDIYTPYGATEALPVASNSATVVLGETAEKTAQGEGTCVGNRFSGIEWKVIRITDGPLPEIADTTELPVGEIGELMVRGDVVTRQYVTRTDANALHKVSDGNVSDGSVANGDGFWHRMGDVGYLDNQDRFWFCGRKTHRVLSQQGTMFTVCCEAIFNNHDSIYRSALVGVGEPGNQIPVLIAEPWPEKYSESKEEQAQLAAELRVLGQANPLTDSIEHVFIQKSLPVDIRHNAKIFREKLAVWAAKQLS